MSLSPELSEVTDFLRAHAPFDCLSTDQLEHAARRIEIVYRRKGEVMLRIGEANTALAVIRRWPLSGAARWKSTTRTNDWSTGWLKATAMDFLPC